MFRMNILLLINFILIENIVSKPYFIDNEHKIEEYESVLYSESKLIKNTPKPTELSTIKDDGDDHQKDYDVYHIKETQGRIDIDDKYIEDAKDIDELKQETWIHDRMKGQSSEEPTDKPISLEDPNQKPAFNDKEKEFMEPKQDKNKEYSAKVPEKADVPTVDITVKKNELIRSTLSPFKELVNENPEAVIAEDLVTSTTPSTTLLIPTTTMISTTDNISGIEKPTVTSEHVHPPINPIHAADKNHFHLTSEEMNDRSSTKQIETVTTTTTTTTTEIPSTTPKLPQIFNKKPEDYEGGISTEFIRPEPERSLLENLLDGLRCAMRDCSGVLVPTQPPKKQELGELSMTRFARGHESGLSTCPCIKYVKTDISIQGIQAERY